MHKQVFRPFWSFDVRQTEKWLSEMAEKGFHLKNLKRSSRIFVFEKGIPKKVTYKIGYSQAQGKQFPEEVINADWNLKYNQNNWFIVNNSNELDPSFTREGVINHNRKNFFICSGILIFLSIIILINLINYLSIRSYPESVRDFLRYGEAGKPTNTPWFLAYIRVLFVAVLIYSIYSVYKIKTSNKLLRGELSGWAELEKDMLNSKGKRSEHEEIELKQQGKLMVKRKFAWMYAPDKLEKWLEAMEVKGYNLYRVDWMGTGFYFDVGTPRKISYCAVYQGLAKESSMIEIKNKGWKYVFSTMSDIQKWTIWSKEYKENEEKPQL